MTVVVQNAIDALTIAQENRFLSYVVLFWVFFAIWFLIQYPTRNARWIWLDKVIEDMYNKMLTYFTKLDNNAIESYGTGKVNNIIQRWLDAQVKIIEWILGAWVKVFLQFIVAAGLVVYYLGWIAWILLVGVLIIILVIAAKSNKRLGEARRMRREQTTFIDSSIVRHIMSKFEILLNNKAEKEAARRHIYRQKRQYHYGIESKRMILVWEWQKLVMDILRIIAFVYAWYAVLHGEMTIGFFSAVWMLTNTVNQWLFDITETLLQYNQGIIYVERLWDFIDKEKLIRGYDTGEEFQFQKGNIELQNVTFNYGKWDILTNFSLQVQGGKKTALVGISGSGKSTIVKLMAGYIHPQVWEVVVDEQSLPNETNSHYVSLQSYYKHIGYLTQEPNVFDGTIYENLTYALDYEPTMEELDAAIQWAQCQFIYEFPEGVQTEIGEKGIKLSGWQRQRLAIAKVMLKNPDIIILDEPTSALDSFSEEEVTKALNNLFERRTVIIIAHRLQTVKKADRIIVLDHGNVVEDGDHDSLVKSGGVYAKMLELQSWF